MNPSIARNIGNSCSTMTNKKFSLMWLTHDLYYAFTFPVLKLNYIKYNNNNYSINYLYFDIDRYEIKTCLDYNYNNIFRCFDYN